MGALRSLERFQAIRVVTVEGHGSEDDPFREVIYTFDERDQWLSRSDPCDPPNIGLTRDEIGLAIDGVAGMVDDQHREAAPLLRKLQQAYVATKVTT